MKPVMQKKITFNWQSVVLIVVIFGLWESAVRVFHIPEWILPRPSDIILELASEWRSLLSHTVSTGYLIVSGFLLGSVCGVLVAMMMHLIPGIRKPVYPLLVISQNIPIIALAPLLMIWFGFGIFPKMLVIILICFFPVTMNMLDGLRNTDRTCTLYMQMIGANSFQIFRKLEFPFSLPYVFSGLKIAATYSVLGAVIAEWLGAAKGIGVYMLLSKNSFQTDHVFLSIGVIIMLALVLHASVSRVEKICIRWNQTSL